MSDIAQPVSGYEIVEGEPPELMGRNLNAAAHLLASATAFFFLAFIFAYFYLRSLNNAHLFRPKHVDPSVTLGTLVMALTVASALLVRLGLLDHRAGRRAQWRPCRIESARLKDVSDWVDQYRAIWEARFGRLDDYLRDLQQADQTPHAPEPTSTKE